MIGPPKESDFWAKLKYRDDDRSTGEIVAWHPLLAHSADVAAVTEALLQRTILRQRLAQLIGWEDVSDIHIARLSALAAMHDAGKVNHGFQNRAFGKKPAADHVSPIIEIGSADNVTEWLEPLGVFSLQGWFASLNDLGYFLLATWGHHGRPVVAKGDFRSSLWRANSVRSPLDGFKQIASHSRKWFPRAFEEGHQPFPSDSVLQHAFNGLLTLADWIGSDQRFFDFANMLDDPMPRSREQAAKAVEQLYLDASQPRQQIGHEPRGFDGVLQNPDWTPHKIQEACLDLPMHRNGSLTILESDTGSGKTEAALARFIRLYQEGLVDGMYFAVPTRSAATQLHGRVTKAVERIFSDFDNRPPVVQAVPGYLKVDDRQAVRLPGFRVLWDEDSRADMKIRGWAAENSKRYLVGPIVVGTVDQVLLSALQVKHAHMRAAALLRHFLIVDEVHASDVYMTALMDRVLEQHLAAGGHALLMSATLGSAARMHLATNGRDDASPLEQSENEEYPLLTHVDARRQQPEMHHARSSGKNKKVNTELRPIAGDPLSVAKTAAEEALAGARVLVIRNLVADCIATQRALEDVAGSETDVLFGVDGISAPHHSRFAPDDRKLLDDQMEVVFGKGTLRQGVVVVATQTVEQSLDIDADLLITDLCPMDVLLQRIGRLHRHRRDDRPEGFETARCIVLTPENRDLTGAIISDGSALKGPHGLGTVYQDLRMIAATWQVLEDENIGLWEIPKHNRLLVERATHPEQMRRIVEESGEDWAEHDRWVLGKQLADRHTAGYVELDYSTPFGETGFAEDLEQVKTRLGQDNYRIELPEKVEGPFGKKIGEVTLSEWQVDGVPEDMTVETIFPVNGGFEFIFAGKRYLYDRFGLDMS